MLELTIPFTLAEIPLLSIPASDGQEPRTCSVKNAIAADLQVFVFLLPDPVSLFISEDQQTPCLICTILAGTASNNSA